MPTANSKCNDDYEDILANPCLFWNITKTHASRCNSYTSFAGLEILQSMVTDPEL